MIYRLTILMTILLMGLAGCKTLSIMGSVKEDPNKPGQYILVPKRYIVIDGAGKGEFTPEGGKIERPKMFEAPKFPIGYKID